MLSASVNTIAFVQVLSINIKINGHRVRDVNIYVCFDHVRQIYTWPHITLGLKFIFGTFVDPSTLYDFIIVLGYFLLESYSEYCNV